MTYATLRLTVLGFCVLLAGCSLFGTVDSKDIKENQQVIEDFISVYDFNPFRPPRDSDGVGTVIAFNDQGQETIVYRPISCLHPESIPPRATNVAIQTAQYDISSRNALEWGMAKVLGVNLDLASILQNEAVTGVKFRLFQPQVMSIEMGTTRRFVESLEEDSCRAELLNTENLIIHSVLYAEGIEYSFTTKRNRVFDLEANLSDSIGAEMDSRVDIVGNTGIMLNQRMYFGYRAWRANTLSGLLLESIELYDLSVEDVEAMRGE